MSGSDDIKVIPGMEAVRRRPGMYCGPIEGGFGLHQLLWGLVEVVIEQHIAGTAGELWVEIDGAQVTVRDDGDGIPTEPFRSTGRSFLELFFTTLHPGGPRHGDLTWLLRATLHGSPHPVACALSRRLTVETVWKGESWTMASERGFLTEDPRRGGALARGTRIHFEPDEAIFPERAFQLEVIEARLQELAWLHPRLAIRFQGRRLDGRGGIAEWVRRMTGGRGGGSAPEVAHFVGPVDSVLVEVAFTWAGNGPPAVRLFVNHAPVEDGAHRDGLFEGLAAIAHRPDHSAGLVAVVAVTLDEPRYRGVRSDRVDGSRHVHLENLEAGRAVRVAVERAAAITDPSRRLHA